MNGRVGTRTQASALVGGSSVTHPEPQSNLMASALSFLTPSRVDRVWSHIRELQQLLGGPDKYNNLGVALVQGGGVALLPHTTNIGETPICCMIPQSITLRFWVSLQPSVKSTGKVTYRCYRMWSPA